MRTRGRPRKEFDKKLFTDLAGIGCSQEEIAWMFRDETGKPANIDTLSRWCKRTFGMNFQEYIKNCGCMGLRITIRKNQLKLSEKSAAMAIWLGKQYLGQKDELEVTAAYTTDETIKKMNEYFDAIPSDAGDK